MSTGQHDTVHVFDIRIEGSIGEADVPVTIKECQFCHSEPLVMFSSEQQQQFREQRGFIIQLPA